MIMEEDSKSSMSDYEKVAAWEEYLKWVEAGKRGEKVGRNENFRMAKEDKIQRFLNIAINKGYNRAVKVLRDWCKVKGWDSSAWYKYLIGKEVDKKEEPKVITPDYSGEVVDLRPGHKKMFSAFLDLPELKRVQLADETVNIGVGSFINCPQLDTIEVNGTVAIYKSAFINCPNLTTIKVKGLSGIDNNCFENCGKRSVKFIIDGEEYQVQTEE